VGIINTQVGSQWYNKIATEISQYKITLGEKGAARYKLDLLLRVAKRVDEFADICAECQAYKQEITNIVRELSLLMQMPSKEAQKKQNKAVSVITEHLKKVHKLVEKGHYMGMGIGIGWAIGAAIPAPERESGWHSE
jgi:t-SNARE complex subunit (syntaxin)